MRINKYLSECGICSRREADRLVEAGHVCINGKKAVPGSQVGDGDEVLVDGTRAVLPGDRIYLKLYKPVGIVSNNFHMYRALRYARKLGYQHPCPIAASCHPVLLLNYMTREFFAVWKMWILS